MANLPDIDITKPDRVEQEPINTTETENGRMAIFVKLLGEDIAVVRWKTDVDPPRWAIWLRQ